MELTFGPARLFNSESGVATLSTIKKPDSENFYRIDYNLAAKEYAGFILDCGAMECGKVSQNLAANFLLEFELRGLPADCRFECKIVTDDGSGVWWVLKPDYSLSEIWQEVGFKRRHFVYAWGASADYLATIKQLEVVLTAKSNGSGHFEVRNLNLREIPSAVISAETCSVSVSSGSGKEALICPGDGKSWQSDALQQQVVELNFDSTTELGGMVINWGQGYAENFTLELKLLGRDWQCVGKVSGFTGGASWHYLPDCEADAIRLTLSQRSSGTCYQIRSIELKQAEFSSSWNSFLTHYAKRSKRGLFPRYLSKEQSYWTVISTSGGRQKALINEEGLIELGYGLPSLDALICLGDSIYGWEDCALNQSLAGGCFPIPEVRRSYPGFELSLTTWMIERNSAPLLYLSYKVTNRAASRLTGELYLAVRPFQVNPPWQFLNTTGGHLPVNSLAFSEHKNGNPSALINDKAKVVSLTKCDNVLTTNFWSGEIAEVLQRSAAEKQTRHSATAVTDSEGMCSGAFCYQFDLQPGEEQEFVLVCAYSVTGEETNLPSATESYRQCLELWQSALAAVKFSIAADPQIEDTVRSQLAYILANRSGAAIQPGTRCYRRTWIRDAAMTSSALLQFGFASEVKEFIEWFHPYVGEDGAVPCVVDAQGVDTTPEHDSHGEYLFLVSEYSRYSGDWSLAAKLLPQLVCVARHIAHLCSLTDGDDFPTHIRGLLPKSISHEGYAHCPAFSYWDNLWALRGLDGLLFLTRQLGAESETAECVQIRDRCYQTVLSSIKQAMIEHKISFIPGAADLGDFDATSTTVGVDPCSLLLDQMPEALTNTFERYFELFTKRREDFSGSDRYTPYELRVVGTFVRLGQPERALEALEFFMSHRRPQGWNHWGEVVWANEREPAFIGDAPHGWVASDFLRSVRSLILYEHQDHWVLGAGISFDWWSKGISCQLITPEGVLEVSSGTNEQGEVWLEVEGTAKINCALHLPSGAIGLVGYDTEGDLVNFIPPLRTKFKIG